jgi:rhodanese-related sulfurtransferase
LFSELGYTYVDVRPPLEIEEVGKVPGSVNIPLKLAKKKFDPEQNKKVFIKEDNPDFLKQIQQKFPDPETAKILIGCSNGTKYSMDALTALDDAGYVNIVGLRGGYYAWFKVFDNKLRRRNFGEYQEDYQHGADSTGIHASGAGFAKADKIDEWVPPEF